MYIKIVINKQNFLIFQMKKKPTIYQTPTHGLHHFPLQCTHPPTGEEREPPTSQTIVLAIKKTIQGSHPERHLRRNMESTGILKNPQSPRVASLLMSDPSLKCFFFSCDSGSGQRNWTQKFCELLTTQYNLFKSVLEYVYCVVNLIFLSALKQKTGGFWSQGLCYPHPLLFAWNSTANQSTANSGQQENPERKSKNWELVQEI